MEELTIEYTIDIVNNVEFDVETTNYPPDNPIVIYYWKYIVLNNINLPSTVIKAQAGKQGTLNNPPDLPEPFVDIPLYQSQSEEILKTQFYGDESSRAKIPGESYSNKKYPKGGTLKSLYNQDPIAYTFNSKVVDETTNKPLSKVKVKNLEDQTTTTNKDGSFEITGTYSPGKPQKLIFNAKKYGVKSEVITDLKGAVRSDINIITLIPDEKDVSSSILKAQSTSDEEREKLTDEQKLEFIIAVATKIIDEIQIRLVPFIILKLLCKPYGICDPLGLIALAQLAADQAKDLNERRKERKEEKELEKLEEDFENEFSELDEDD